MLVSRIEDAMRSKLGVADISPDDLLLYRQLARSEIESKGKFYWQASHEDITIPVAVDEFEVKVDFVVPDFIDFRFVALQKNGLWRFLFPGSWQSTLEGVDADGTGFPERCTYENGTLTISPIPADEIEGRLFYFAATEEPEASSDTDTLYTDFPQLILYMSLAVASRMLNKDAATVKAWEDLAQEQIDAALEYTEHVLGEDVGKISASTAAKILQNQVAK